MTDLSAPMFTDETAARAHLEGLRWPNGPVCPHCGSVDNATLMQGKSTRAGTYQCNGCCEPFTVTVGTVMESSHLPLNKWVLAFHLMAASKKGMSAAQMSRMLDITYKTAWFLCHRIREAMIDTNAAPLGGEGKVIEVDETYHGKRELAAVSPARKGRPYIKKGKAAEKRAVIGLVERGGKARLVALTGKRVTSANIEEILEKHADRKSAMHTDESRLYLKLGEKFAAHKTVLHAQEEYARWEKRQMITTNSVEGFFGILKRGLNGVYQHCGEQHFQRYLTEFEFRYNHRIRLGFNDDQRAALAIKGAEGKRLTYRGL